MHCHIPSDETPEQEQPVSASELTGIARGRSQVYAILSGVLNKLPTVDLLRDLQRAVPIYSSVQGDQAGESAAEELQRLLAQLPVEGPSNDPDLISAVTEVAVERTRLLRGVKPGYGLPPACESVYRALGSPKRGRQGSGKEGWVAIHHEYEQDGYQSSPGLPPDFVGNEVLFLAFLCEREAIAWEREDTPAALSAVRREAAFLEEHPLRWLGTLSSAVESAASSRFWPAILNLLAAYLRVEWDYLRELTKRESPQEGSAGTR